MLYILRKYDLQLYIYLSCLFLSVESPKYSSNERIKGVINHSTGRQFKNICLQNIIFASFSTNFSSESIAKFKIYLSYVGTRLETWRDYQRTSKLFEGVKWLLTIYNIPLKQPKSFITFSLTFFYFLSNLCICQGLNLLHIRKAQYVVFI